MMLCNRRLHGYQVLFTILTTDRPKQNWSPSFCCTDEWRSCKSRQWSNLSSSQGGRRHIECQTFNFHEISGVLPLPLRMIHHASPPKCSLAGLFCMCNSTFRICPMCKAHHMNPKARRHRKQTFVLLLFFTCLGISVLILHRLKITPFVEDTQVLGVLLCSGHENLL